ncbi:nuclear transport factor 2 family protein [Microbacterium sp. ARD31]|uniref:nuclear transport factor 2 family protein n=1 Tax=Microbacterium sp. ARD31 TaxID=2962576 RepID=UPI0028822C47|nr:nuclear transport factor 2 family protein [Microbacterium sp. ARD31]MDT0183962.1 nuclear transport factor 2 family protein [Microbacterium sp. ARD31]
MTLTHGDEAVAITQLSNPQKLVAFQQLFVDGADESVPDLLLDPDFRVDRAGLVSALGALAAIGDIAPMQLQAGELSKIEGLVEGARAMRAAFGDWSHHDHVLIADGDIVSGHWTVTARHTGDFFGVPATGRTFSFTEAGTIRFEDGKIKEFWFLSDTAEFLAGIGYSLAGHKGGDAASFTPHPNVDLLRRHYEAFTARDLDAIAARYAPDVVWHGDHAQPGEALRGREAVMDVIRLHLSRSDDSARHQVQSIVGDGHYVMSHLTYRAARPDGRVISGNESQIHRMNADGTIAEVWTFLEDSEGFRDWQQDEDGDVHPLIAQMKSAVAAASDDLDLSLLRAMMAEDAVLHADGTSPLGGDHHGRDNVLGNFPNLTRIAGGSLALEITEIVANEHFLVMLNRATAERNGHDLSQMICVIWRFVDGRAVEMWDHFADVGAWDAFWALPGGDAR